jgi:hypothetical protein
LRFSSGEFIRSTADGTVPALIAPASTARVDDPDAGGRVAVA